MRTGKLPVNNILKDYIGLEVGVYRENIMDDPKKHEYYEGILEMRNGVFYLVDGTRENIPLEKGDQIWERDMTYICTI